VHAYLRVIKREREREKEREREREYEEHVLLVSNQIYY
jgi:hypothetical protein